jgi:hypothetical protein
MWGSIIQRRIKKARRLSNTEMYAYMMLFVSFMLYDDDVGCHDRCTDVSHLLLLSSNSEKTLISIDVSLLLLLSSNSEKTFL